MSNPYRSSYRGIAFAATLVVLAISAVVLWMLGRHDPVMAELRLEADRAHLQATVPLSSRDEVSTIGATAGDGDATPGSAAPVVDAQPSENAELFDGPGDLPRIGLIINDLGQLAIQTEAAMAAPAPVTLAFSPYSRELELWIPQAREAGHETLIMLPMEPEDYPRDDPGPLALLTTLGTADNAERLQRILSDADQSVGIIGQAGSQFLTDSAALEPVFQTLADAGFLYVDSNWSEDLVGEVAASVDLTVVDIDVMITETALGGAIDQQLLVLESLARERGFAVGLADAYPVFFDRLADWSERLEIRGFALAPITSVSAGASTP
ncbi:MAG: divergent polysaccharide deacetylase family protein [Pseudomonadota bacterium]